MRMIKSMKMNEKEAKEYFLSVADLKNQITKEKFR